jgi:hypothetical protein
MGQVDDGLALWIGRGGGTTTGRVDWLAGGDVMRTTSRRGGGSIRNRGVVVNNRDG